MYTKTTDRVKAFRKAHPFGVITTDVLHVGDGWCIVQAKISDENDNLLAVAHKMESKDTWPEFIESAESWAVGRALGFAGYGECDDEGDKVVDGFGGGNDTGSYVVKFGDKYRGQKLKDIPENSLRAYTAWIEGEQRIGKLNYADAKELIAKAKEYLNETVDASLREMQKDNK